jgi:ArsR family transcriptional regulator
MDPHFDGVIFQTHAAELARRLGRPFPPLFVLDVRPEEAFAAGHVPGALALAAADLAGTLPAGAGSTTELFVVGRGPGDPAVRELSLALRRLGAERVVELSGGMHEWNERRLPVEAGAGRTARAA